MDVEALQAQIDLSNSIAYDLVSSWVKPSASSSTESASHAISRELEEFAKRPPRLGLGATVPKSTLATSRDAARLKGKLVGQKRQRDGNGDDDRATGIKRLHQIQDDEDEDESRSAAISTKKARIKAARGLGQGKPQKPMDTTGSQKGKSIEEPQVSTLFSIPTDILTGAPLPKPKHTSPTPSPIVNGTALGAPRPSPSRHLPPPLPSQPTPLLNLHGPPVGQMEDETLTHSQGESGSPRKKKRRRRGKRRKNCGGEDAA